MSLKNIDLPELVLISTLMVKKFLDTSWQVDMNSKWVDLGILLVITVLYHVFVFGYYQDYSET